jgi:hypothetical protein
MTEYNEMLQLLIEARNAQEYDSHSKDGNDAAISQGRQACPGCESVRAITEFLYRTVEGR